MAEIMIAPGRYDLASAKKLADDYRKQIFGAKILINDSYVVTEENERHGRYGAIACMLKSSGISRIMVDAKIPNDTPSEMKDITNSILASYTPRKSFTGIIEVPDFMTVHFTAPRKSLSMFTKATSRLGIEPVCFTTSSRYEEQDFIDLGSNSADYIKKSTEAISELGFKAVIAAACDAELINTINSDLVVFGTGGIINQSEETTHSRTVLYEEAKEFVDVFVEGSTILQSQEPMAAFEERYIAAA